MRKFRRVVVTHTYDWRQDASAFTMLEIDGEYFCGRSRFDDLLVAFARLSFHELDELECELSALRNLLNDFMRGTEPRQEILL